MPFEKSKWKKRDAEDFWYKYDVRYFHKEQDWDKEVPPMDTVYDLGGGEFIGMCRRKDSKKLPFGEQLSLMVS